MEFKKYKKKKYYVNTCFFSPAPFKAISQYFILSLVVNVKVQYPPTAILLAKMSLVSLTIGPSEVGTCCGTPCD